MSSSMCSATLLPEPDEPAHDDQPHRHGAALAHPTARLEDVLGVMVGGLFLVFLDAAVELVGQRVDGGIHVLFGGVGVDLVPAHHQGGLGLVAHFFDREHAVDVDQLLEMPGDALEFLENVAAQ